MLDRTAQSWEPKFATAAAECFEQDKRELLALLTEHYGKALHRKATVNWTEYEVDVGAWLTEHADGRWRQTFAPLVQGVITDQARNWEAALGVQFDTVNLASVAWFEDYMLQFAQPITDTTRQGLTDLLAQAQIEGWGMDKTRNAMGQVFRQWAEGDVPAGDLDFLQQRMPQYRREMIARTETIRASAAGSQSLFVDWGVQQKQWLATRDGRTRDAHAAADGQVREINEAFDIGGYKMMYPGDAGLGAPPSMFVNCRCALAPYFSEEAS